MRHTAEVKRLDVWSLFKVAFVLYATLGIVAGIFYGLVFALLGSLGGVLGDEDLPGLGFLTGFIGVLAIPVLGVMYGVIGSAVIAIGGGLYNIAARWVGGVRIDLRTVDSPAAPAAAREPSPPAST